MHTTHVVPSSTTLLAYGITEWTGAIEHLEAMARVSVFVPAQTTQTLMAERRILLWRWEDKHNRFRSITDTVANEIIAEARAWLTEHIEETELIERKVNGS